jgi:hypothetical protein
MSKLSSDKTPKGRSLDSSNEHVYKTLINDQEYSDEGMYQSAFGQKVEYHSLPSEHQSGHGFSAAFQSRQQHRLVQSHSNADLERKKQKILIISMSS